MSQIPICTICTDPDCNGKHEDTSTMKKEAKILTTDEKVKEVNKLLQSWEPEDISHDTYSGYSGYKPQYVIDSMNAIFGVGNWGFEEIQTRTTKKADGTPELAICQVKVFLSGISFKPMAWGQSRVTKGDLGDAKKGAQTDAIKKGLSYFSIGNRAFHGKLEEKQEKTPQKPTQASSQNNEDWLDEVSREIS